MSKGQYRGIKQARPDAGLLSRIRNPLFSLPKWGRVHHQAEGIYLPFDPKAITHKMQLAMLSYYANPPRHAVTAMTLWLTVLTARQMGKSTTAEYAAYPVTAFTPGLDHVCIADTKPRAEYLHSRIHGLHLGWDGPVKAGTVPARETRQLTFDPLTGGRMRILSAESSAVGIGQSPDSFHASECPFWSAFGTTMSFIYPSIRNRRNALAVFEATPYIAGSDWHDHCRDAFARKGRHLGLFFPYWDGKLNSRPWPEGSRLDLQEIRLLEQYRDQGLALEHLAFRREVMEEDAEIRRNPELFDIYYPFDPVRCWIIPSGGAIPKSIVEKARTHDLEPWQAPEACYHEPHPNAQYVIGVDPSGYAARDHSAVQVLEVWSDEWRQVATYAESIDPTELWEVVERLARRYNNALVVIESNGVGQGLISLARARGYHNLYYERVGRPGLATTSSSAQSMISWLVEALERGMLQLHDHDLVDQLSTYKNDKAIERSPTSETLANTIRRKADQRRSRHHWDKVSALLMAVAGARQLPNRYRSSGQRSEQGEVVLLPGVSFADLDRNAAETRAKKAQGRVKWRTKARGVYRTRKRR